MDVGPAHTPDTPFEGMQTGIGMGGGDWCWDWGWGEEYVPDSEQLGPIQLCFFV